jgi:hypothetical protein
MKKMPYSIFLDDLRSVNMVYPSNAVVYENFIEDFYICRTMEQAVALIEEKGFLPYYISFDNDLGLDANGNLLKAGLDFAHWIVESVLDEKYVIPDNFKFFVHSANTIAGPEIKILLDNFIQHLRREKQ